MNGVHASLVYSRISARFVASRREVANLLIKRPLASRVICNITSPMFLTGKEILHI
jgi:hypothetical protein